TIRPPLRPTLFPYTTLFRSFDLANLERHQCTQELDILFLMDKIPQRGLLVDKNTFMLGCTPIINLFQKTTEPIRLDHREYEYRRSEEHTSELQSQSNLVCRL